MKFYSDLSLLDLDALPLNVYDLESAYFYVSLLPMEMKHRFLTRLNPEARRAYGPILNIDEEFISSVDECDYILFPPCSSYMGFVDYMDSYSHILKRATKPVAIFYFSSDDTPYQVGNAIQLFRGGSYRSQNRNNVHGSLYVVADYYKGVLSPKELKVSYCGYINDPYREEVISKFNKYDYFNSIIRDNWGGSKYTDSPDCNSYLVGPSVKDKREFIENMEASLYSLIVRGRANATYRFFESFMMGRIPVLIDTDYMLPFCDIIPYETNMVIVPYGEDYDIALRQFHNSHSEEELYKIQLENRSIWEKYFRADSAYYTVKEFLSEI